MNGGGFRERERERQGGVSCMFVCLFGVSRSTRSEIYAFLRFVVRRDEGVLLGV